MLCFLAVCLPIMLMRLGGCLHPAAIGSALAFIVFERNVQSLLMLLLAVIGLLTAVKILVYVYLEELVFSDFGKEFHREFYGKELTVTLVEPKGNGKAARIELKGAATALCQNSIRRYFHRIGGTS